MLDLRLAAVRARERVKGRLDRAALQKGGMRRSAAIVQQGASFRTQLLEAMRRGGDDRFAPSTAPEGLFLAFPEKLLGKWSYLAFGEQRNGDKQTDDGLQKDHKAWKSWDSLGEETRFKDLSRSELKAVLVAHGLSPIQDSTLLLADIGRGLRAARAVSVPLRVLLADVSWMSYNRSVRRFDLTEGEIESGLRLALDRRQRLYSGVCAETRVHGITSFPKKGAISAAKIRKISERYLELAAALWGEDKVNTSLPLENRDVALIGRALGQSVRADSPLAVLGKFPGALTDLEKSLGQHLGIMRTLVQSFRNLSPETLSYYFAQYYAQDGYRGTHLKVAPVSEQDFDEPYDNLDESFRSWGEGHESDVAARLQRPGRRRRLAAVYLPQYGFADWNILPYTPLSLSAVAQGGGLVANVKERLILLSDRTPAAEPKAAAILQATLTRGSVERLNRFVFDLVSFLQGVALAQGKVAVESVAVRFGWSLEALLAKLQALLPEAFMVEIEEDTPSSKLWSAWLDAIEAESAPRYTPSHVGIASMVEEDWSQESVSAAARLTIVANAVAMDLCGYESAS